MVCRNTAIPVTRCICVPDDTLIVASMVRACDTALSDRRLDSEIDRHRVLKVSQCYIILVDTVRCSTGLLEGEMETWLVDYAAHGQTTVNKGAPIHYIIPINDMVHRPF